MTLKEAKLLKQRISNIQILGENSMESLRRFADEIEDVFVIIASKKSEDVHLDGTGSQFQEAKISLTAWFKQRKKSNISLYGKEIKSDLTDVISSLIEVAEKFKYLE